MRSELVRCLDVTADDVEEDYIKSRLLNACPFFVIIDLRLLHEFISGCSF